MGTKLRFPNGFLWGAATSAHQVEGGNHNSWTTWELAHGHHIRDGSRSGKAADHWHRYDADFRALADLKLNAYRFSIEWSRLEARSGDWDEAAMEHYAKMVSELKSLGIAPMVTLHHFTNPVWVEQQGGWTNPQTVEHFAAFALRVVERLGPDVGLWCTINEPTVEIGLGYMVGTFPPGRQDLIAFLRARRHMLQAHRRLYTAIHDLYRAKSWPEPKVSFAHHLSWVEPYRPGRPLDRLSAWIYNRINNTYFLERTRRHSDFIGINYYFFRRLKFALGGDLVIAREMPVPRAPRSDLGWPVEPEGLYRLCRRVAKYGKPLYVTENGLADAADRLRPWAIAAHAEAIHRAIAHGADVRGYFHWSLLDTFEWENGYGARYGLLAVDFQTQKRTPRPSAGLYTSLASSNSLTAVPPRPAP